MMDIVERLRDVFSGNALKDIANQTQVYIKERYEAADEIERLREALREIYEVYAGSEGIPQPMTAAEGYLLSLFMEAVKIAQEARRRKSDG